MQRQYSGTLGRVDNCRIGTFLAYADTAGDRVLIDRELYTPERSWCAGLERRAEVGVPGNLTFAIRPQQVQTMIDRTIGGRGAKRRTQLLWTTDGDRRHTTGRPTTATTTPERAPRGRVRHLFNLTNKDDHTVELGLHWPNIRRGHRAEARRRHFRRRLRLQIIQI